MLKTHHRLPTRRKGTRKIPYDLPTLRETMLEIRPARPTHRKGTKKSQLPRPAVRLRLSRIHPLPRNGTRTILKGFTVAAEHGVHAASTSPLSARIEAA